jgi:hypothetical protein
MTYLELVNEVLLRLRENTVGSVSQSTYSKQIALYVNDAKRQVEEAWDWDALTSSFTVSIGPGLGYSGSSTRYLVPGIGTRQKNVFVNNTSVGYKSPINLIAYSTLAQREQMSTTTITGVPHDYSWYGNNGTDSIMAIWPTPNSNYTLTVNANVPQQNLVNDTDILSVPADCVVMGAFARALVDRGEDGGLSSGEAYNLFKMTLADRVSIEQSRSEEYDAWVIG